MKKLTFAILMMIVQTVTFGANAADPENVHCSHDLNKKAAEQHVQNVPHYSSGYQFLSVSLVPTTWRGRIYCTVTYRRDTDYCDPYFFRIISVDPYNNQVIDDKYSDSVWCGY